MAETTIEWASYTFNPVRGCTKISPGCTNCYAETMSKRNPATLGIWGDKGTRVVAAESYWKMPLKWNRDAIASERNHERACMEATSEYDMVEPYQRPRVFCASLADVFEDRPEWEAPRVRLFKLIEETPHLDWLLLTKRPEFMIECLNQTCLWGEGWLTHPRPNVWLGVSVEDQQRADERIPLLLRTPAAVRFLSVEPLLGPVELTNHWYTTHNWHNWLTGETGLGRTTDNYCSHKETGQKVNWVIVGGESGAGARPCSVEWVRSIIAQCKAADVACFVKQLGREVTWDAADGKTLKMIDRKGGDMDEWVADLRVREFPEVRR